MTTSEHFNCVPSCYELSIGSWIQHFRQNPLAEIVRVPLIAFEWIKNGARPVGIEVLVIWKRDALGLEASREIVTGRALADCLLRNFRLAHHLKFGLNGSEKFAFDVVQRVYRSRRLTEFSVSTCKYPDQLFNPV